jgi:hypothetical protein
MLKLGQVFKSVQLLFLVLRHAAKHFDHHLVKPALHTKLLTLPTHEGSTRVAQRFDMTCVSTHE